MHGQNGTKPFLEWTRSAACLIAVHTQVQHLQLTSWDCLACVEETIETLDITQPHSNHLSYPQHPHRRARRALDLSIPPALFEFSLRPRQSKHMDSSLVEIWQAAQGSRFNPTVGKDSQFLVAIFLVLLGLVGFGSFTLSRSIE